MRHLPLIASLVILPASLAAAEEVRIVTEDFWPFNYREGAEIVGIGPDQIAEIADRTGIDMPVEIMPWSRALFLAESEPGTCVITTAQIDERLDRFAWVGPLATEENFLVRAVGSDVDAATLDEARPLRVGVVAGDFLASMLETEGFAALDVAPELSLNGRKLVAGRIDLVAVTQSDLEALIAEGAEVEPVVTLPATAFSAACHRSMPEATIAQMQAALDALIADGTQAAIHQRHQ